LKLYFTEKLTPQEIAKVAEHPDFGGLKYYPRGLTTGSDDGISDPKLLWTPGTNPYEVLRFMREVGKPVSYHGADGFTQTGEELDPYEQEEHFYRESFRRIVDAHPDTRHIGEHVTTIGGVETYREIGCDTIGCTITAHHPFLDRRDVYRGGFHPDLFGWPVVQTTEHRDELRKFMTEGHRFVMLGDDGAGHPSEAKYCGCCAGGVFTVGSSIELYAQVFDQMKALDRFEAFSSLNGPRFYGVEPSNEYITLVNTPWQPKSSFVCDDGTTEVIGYRHPMRPGNKLPPRITWKIAD
jgi:dihydroorotase